MEISGDIVATILDCDILVGEFEIQSLNYAQFRINTLEKGMNPFYLPSLIK